MQNPFQSHARVLGTPNPPLSPDEAAQASRLRQAARSPIADMLPVVEPVLAWFHQITIPAAFTVNANHSAWYVLRSISIPGDFARDAMLVGYSACLLPSDQAGSGIGTQVPAASAGTSGTALAWNDVTGTSAAIIITRNLGIAANVWTSRPSPDVAGIELGLAGAAPANTLVTPAGGGGGARTPISLRFPTGKFSDTTPNVSEPRMMFLPGQYPLRKNSTLDVALVVGKQYFTGSLDGSHSRVLCGRGEVTLYIADMAPQGRDRIE